MSRLYLIIILFLSLNDITAQREFKRYVEFGQEKSDKGDYLHALSYFDKAMEIDSSDVDLLWQYAQTLRAFKDYRKAAFYYEKLRDLDEAQLYPLALLYQALMTKQNGRYEKAEELFKEAKKLYAKDKKAYAYQKSVQEIKSCRWAQEHCKDSVDVIMEHLPEHINTSDAEFAHRVHNNQLIYSSLRADSVGSKLEIYDQSYKTRLFSSYIDGSIFGSPQRIEALFFEKLSSGNGAFSLDGSRFYFSLCEDESFNYRCKIMVAYYDSGEFTDIDSLGTIINHPGSNTTMPFISELDNSEVLFFASDRAEGKGGMDIWMSKITGGNHYGSPINLVAINTIDQELSPYYDDKEQTLYFSSNWHEGFGGYDIFSSVREDNQFLRPQNLGQPFNSPANDLYFFKTASRDSMYWSSNRLGTNYVKNPTCCSDIFLGVWPIPPFEEDTVAIQELLAWEELLSLAPLTLYFHNDEPGKRSWDTISPVDYKTTYEFYLSLEEEYLTEYSGGLSGEKAIQAREDMTSFYNNYVKKGWEDLNRFKDLLLSELERGRKLQIEIQGFASPLAKTDYNVNLTKRRINSFLQYLESVDDGVFYDYLNGTASNGGSLSFVEVPLGEYQADQTISDNPNDVQKSVYSIAASVERKVVLQAIREVKEVEDEYFLSVDKQVHHFGSVKRGEKVIHTFTLSNPSEKIISITELFLPCDCLTYQLDQTSLAPRESTSISLTLNTTNYVGHHVKSLYLKYEEDKELRLVIIAEVED